MRERAERDSSAHAAAAPERHPPEHVRPSLLHAVTELGWLPPRAASLAALGHSPSSAVWSALRDDPGAVLLLLRLPAAQPVHDGRRASFISLLDDTALPDAALEHLTNSSDSFVAWDDPAPRPIYHAALTCARIAEQLAVRTGHADADEAWVGGMLAPLGWLAVYTVAPAKAAACLSDPGLVHDAVETQFRHWGSDHASLSRRLARRWQLPDWLTVLVGHLGLPEAQARAFGADPALVSLDAAWRSTPRAEGVELGLSRPEWGTESAAALGLYAHRCGGPRSDRAGRNRDFLAMGIAVLPAVAA